MKRQEENTRENVQIPTLEEVLRSREERVERIERLRVAYPHSTQLCFKLNIPGAVKRNAKIEAMFDRGVECIREVLEKKSVEVVFEQQVREKTGLEYDAVLHPAADTEAAVRSHAKEGDGTEEERCFSQQVKHWMVELEEERPWHRLFDIDVEGENGAISREEIGALPRRCFLCDAAAKNCARSRKHSVEEMWEWIDAVWEAAQAERS